MLDDAFCLSPEPDELAPAQAELEHLRADNARLRTTEHQLRLMNVALGEAFQRQKERAEETEADLERLRDYADKMEDEFAHFRISGMSIQASIDAREFNRVRDRALGIIVSRTAEVDRLKKELAAAKKPVLRADAPAFVPASKPQTLREAVLVRLREKGYIPHDA
jgi:hypothetical protein